MFSACGGVVKSNSYGFVASVRGELGSKLVVRQEQALEARDRHDLVTDLEINFIAHVGSLCLFTREWGVSIHAPRS